MGFVNCYKYETKAKKYEEEVDRLFDRIKDLESIPRNPKTDHQIVELRYKRTQLESKRIEALDEFNQCMESGADDHYDDH